VRRFNDRSVNARLISVFIVITSVTFTSTLGVETGFPERLDIEGLKMFRVNPGTFTMGVANMPPRAEPFEGLRTVEMDKAFYLGEVEVSQAFWSRHMELNPSRFQSPSLPVEGITWLEAMNFCGTLNLKKEKFKVPEEMVFRLPSEAEWEYAARAGSKTTFFFGNNSETLTQYAWISDNSENSTKPIGLLSPNQWGFLDIYGNVREWCLDGYGARPSGKLKNPLIAWKNMDKVSRGGSWDSCDACCKTAKRMNYGENYQSSDIGFRLAIGYEFPDMNQK
jgi:formylglycine-generating enzyme required for sulfatase activity